MTTIRDKWAIVFALPSRGGVTRRQRAAIEHGASENRWVLHCSMPVHPILISDVSHFGKSGTPFHSVLPSGVVT